MPITRVLHVIASVERAGGGPIEGVFQQASYGEEDGFSVHIACLDPPNSSAVLNSPVPTYGLGAPRGNAPRPAWNKYGYEPAMVPWLRNNVRNYDVVVVDGLWNYATMAARRVLVGGTVPYVVFTHGMLDPWFQKTYPIKGMMKQALWLVNEGPLLNSAAGVFFTTEDEKETSRNAFYPYCVRERVVGFGTSPIPGHAETQKAAFRASVPALGGKPYLLFLGRIHEKKGCDLLVEAYGTVAAHHPDLDLVMAGPDQTGMKEDLERRATALGIAERIHWTGMIGGDVKWGALRGCEAFVLPSHQENFGIAVAEALAASRPVLISNKVQIWREVMKGGAGLVDSDDLPGTIRQFQAFLAMDPTAREAMGQAAGVTFANHFEMSRAVRTINRELRNAIAAFSPRRIGNLVF